MKFTIKILMMPLAAFLALTVIFALLWGAGHEAQDQFDLVQNEQVLALELSHRMEKLAIEMRQSLADAATVGDADRVIEADSLANLFREVLSEYSQIPSVEISEVESITEGFAGYYGHARETSLRMLNEELDDSLVMSAIQMNAAFETLHQYLDNASMNRQEGIAAAFDAARDNIKHSGKAISLTIFILFLVLLFVSIGAIASVLRPLRRLTNATEAVSRGDLNTPIDYCCGDEMGRMADSFRHMQASLIADLERREKMEAAIRESEKQYRLLADNMSDTIWTMNRENEFTYFSPSVERLLGYSQEEAINLSQDDWFPNMDCSDVQEEFEALMENENPRHQSISFENEMTRKDGGVIWLEMSIYMLIDENDEFVGLSGVLRDITNRKLVQEALRDSEERLRSVFINSTLGIFRTSPSGKVIATNPAAARMFGYESPEETIKDIESLAEDVYADSEDRHWVIEALQLNGELSAEIMFKRKGANGEIFPAQLNTWTIKDDDGNISCIEGMIEDITDRQLMQEAVRSSEERLQLAFDAANDGMFDYNIAEDDMYLSPRYASMLGYEPHELRAGYRAIRDIIHPDDFEKGPVAFEQHLKSGQPYNLEARFRHKDGHYVWIHTRAKVVEWDEQGDPLRFVGTNVDISARKEAEEELKKAQQELLDTAHNAGMAEIATSVLHNVGNALNGAITSTTVMNKSLKNSRITHLKKLADLVNEHEDDFVNFVENSDQGKKLPKFFAQVNEVLAAERVQLREEMGSLEKSHEHIRQIIALQQQYAGAPGYKEDVYPEELIEDAVQLFGSSFARHHIEFSVNQHGKSKPIKVEKHKVLQILINLLKNARDAVRDISSDGREIMVDIYQDDTDDLRIEVRDNGIGIAEEHLEKIFGYGFTTKRDGHGYGLHGCANSAREMGGVLTATSEGANEGATFTLSLGLKEPEEERARTADVG
jgi:PAS domain S-box-containing protein